MTSPNSRPSARRLQSRPTQRRRETNWAAGIVYAIVALVLLLFVLNRLILRGQLAFGPTPTPSKSPTPFATSTIDVRATLAAQELLTQTAIAAIAVGETPPTPLPTATGTATWTPTPIRDIFAPSITPTPTAVKTFVALIPDVGVGVGRTPTPATGTDAPTETPTPTPAEGPATETATVPSDTATPTDTVAPTPTPTPLPPVQAATATLQAFTLQETTVLDGPSSLYTNTATFASGQRLFLQGRDSFGDWLYICCEANVAGWVRQASLRIDGNALPAGAPVDSDPNDVRLLAEALPATLLDPLRLPTPVPDTDYPQFRRVPEASASVPRTFLPPYQSVWLNQALAGGALTSPVVVVGPSVMVASEDLHLYSFEKESGSQRWRTAFDQVIRTAPVVQDANIYVATSSGQILGIQDQGNRTVELWRSSIGVQPASGLNKQRDLLFIAGSNQQLFALNRQDGSIRWNQFIDGNAIQYPVVGSRNQLVYVGNNSIQARDIFNGTLIWERADVGGGIAVPAVYGFPGTKALAELYVADNLGTIRNYDANTGELLWVHQDARRTTSLALDDTRLFAAGTSFVKAIDRRNGTELWNQTIPEDILSGPIVGQGRLLVISTSGVIRVFDSLQGALLYTAGVPTSAIGAAAVSGPWLFVPGADGRLYERRESSAN